MNKITKRLYAAREVAIKAGDLLLSLFRKKIDVCKKKTGGYVSNADIASSRLIHTAIHKAFPEDGYFCEERGSYKESSNGFKWIVDPLDGTTNFIRGNGDFSISICLALKDVPVIGLVYAPYRNEIYYAVGGDGAWAEYGFYKSRKRLKVSGIGKIKGSILEFPGGIEIEHRAQKEMTMIGIFYPGIRLRVSESAALSLCKVAAGETDAYIHPTEKPHDFMAGSLIVKEASGIVKNFPDRHLSINNLGIIACNKKLYRRISGMIKTASIGNPEYWLENKL